MFGVLVIRNIDKEVETIAAGEINVIVFLCSIRFVIRFLEIEPSLLFDLM